LTLLIGRVAASSQPLRAIGLPLLQTLCNSLLKCFGPLQVVADQIRLWQQELTRLQMHSAMLYDKFESQELYVGAVEHARQLGALLFRCDKRMQLAVPAALHGAMRTHLQERKRALGL
jgi:hypothetical protein